MNGAFPTVWSRSPRISAQCTEIGARPVFVVHSLVHAVAALTASAETGRPIVLLSAPDAGIYAGPGWFKAVVDAAAAKVPTAEFSTVLDCGDRAGAVQGAIRAGVKEV